MSNTHIDRACKGECPSDEDFDLWVKTALLAENREREVSIRLVSQAESQTLNREYRGKDKPTNVLSFPSDFPDFVDDPLLGDLAICNDVVNREAHEQGKSEKSHWAHMTIHGVLHLQGFDHINDADAQQMESLEIQLLASLGYADPYTAIDD